MITNNFVFHKFLFQKKVGHQEIRRKQNEGNFLEHIQLQGRKIEKPTDRSGGVIK